MYDLLIKNGLIVDGGGAPPFNADLAVKGGQIGELAPHLGGRARRVIDAEGRAVCPGFIDVHSHDDLVFFDDPENRPKLLQGVSTVVVGNCGFGPCPTGPENRAALAAYARPVLGDGAAEHAFPNFSSYAAALDKTEKAQNVAALMAHGALYINENGFSAEKPGARESGAMRAQFRAALAAGALGLSAGLMYAPDCYCGAAELTPLLKIAAEFGGLFCVHLRSESARLSEAIEEAVDLGRASGAAVHISHLKKVGQIFKGDIGGVAADLEKRIADGLDLSFDMYPYNIGSTTMSVIFPPDLMTGGILGCLERLREPETRARLKRDFEKVWPEADNLALHCGWDGLKIASTPAGGEDVGRSFAEVARRRGLDAGEAAIRIFEEGRGQVTMLLFNMTEEDLRDIITSPSCLIGSDGLPAGDSPHPRLYGNFPHFLENFVMREGRLSLAEAIRKMTSASAKRFGLGRRGFIAPGFAADLNIFEPAAFKDLATFENPRRHPAGLDYVIVAGETAAENGEATGARRGRFLRR